MKRMAWMVVLGAALVGCRGKDGGGPTSQKASEGGSQVAGLSADGSIREPAVAGGFYPKSPDELAAVVDTLLAILMERIPGQVEGRVHGLICPHAGYQFSGMTAGVAYKQVMGADIETVVVLAPSHTARFEGASISKADAYRTPLGIIPLSPKAAQLAKLKPFVPESPCDVVRPRDWASAPKQAPPVGQDTPHTWEHSVEVQLPFLQRALPGFQLVPVVYGDVDPAEAAKTLSPFVDDRTLVVASSDLSHYKPYDLARGLDQWCVQAVSDMDVKAMSKQEACGNAAILTLMHLAKERGWKPIHLDYRTSADPPAKADKGRVVGYMSFAFVSAEKEKEEPLTAAEKKILLDLARQAVTSAVQKGSRPVVDRVKLPRKFLHPKAAFVTVKREGKLRGCIGYSEEIRPLCETVVDVAAGAAVRDRRFIPVTPEELAAITIEVSVLTTPARIYYNTPSDLLTKLRPKIDGVVLTFGQARGVYLPDVWKDIPDPEKFMQSLTADKAGLPPDTWRDPAAEIRTFQTDAFEETKAP